VRKQHKKVEAQVEGKGEGSSKQVNKRRKKVIFDLICLLLLQVMKLWI